MKHYARTLVLLILLFTFVLGSTADAKGAIVRREWRVDSVAREALLHLPKEAKQMTNGAPIVFAFHGHGGSMHNAAKMFHIETLWPGAIVVYMNGLNTPGHLTDPEGKRQGWQRHVGDQNDRDLKFFDAVFASLVQEYKVDTNRVFSTGHSNGGAFTYLLWEARGKYFSGFAPSASLHPPLISFSNDEFLADSSTTNLSSPGMQVHKVAGRFIPKPVLHIAAENDALVKYQWQKRFLEHLRRRSECGQGELWSKDKRCTLYPSDKNGQVITYIHPGTHKYPEEAPELVVKFFQHLP